MFQAQREGVHVVVAAGNKGKNQCGLYLGGEDGVICVGATDSDDEQAYDSNFGPCVDRECRS
jgi:subtilisin family serine protease